MLQDFVLIQRKAIDDDFALNNQVGACVQNAVSNVLALDQSVSAPQEVHSWFQFKTCLRNMILGPKEELARWKLSENDEMIEGEKSYQYFLEVICGLHSSLVGETEILGQFKTAAAQFNFPNSHFGFELKKFFQAMLEDVKKVRTKYLSDLGSQSYGSLLRKEVKRLSQNQVHIIGAGHLCEEILPWIAKDGTDVHLHVRNLKTAQKKFKVPSLIWNEIKEGQSLKGILVIAAPLSTSDIQSFLKNSDQITQIYDLRHNSEIDKIVHPTQKNCTVTSLAQFMTILSENVETITERKESALAMINQMTKIRSQTVEHRPFGWEDMTA